MHKKSNKKLFWLKTKMAVVLNKFGISPLGTGDKMQLWDPIKKSTDIFC